VVDDSVVEVADFEEGEALSSVPEVLCSVVKHSGMDRSLHLHHYRLPEHCGLNEAQEGWAARHEAPQ
jgi:hypothetical protein